MVVVVITMMMVQLKQFKIIGNVKKTIDLDKQWWCGGNYGGYGTIAIVDNEGVTVDETIQEANNH